LFDTICSDLHPLEKNGFDRPYGLFGAVRAAAMAKQVDQDPVTTERLERALVLLAYFIELDGDVHLPMYEKFEAELTELKTKEAAKHRARKRLQSYLNEGGGLKAIR
jgi:phage antirepressor YoqD-like protein